MKKKTVLIGVGALALGIVAIPFLSPHGTGFFSVGSSGCGEPPRPETVPQAAKWAGGCDGGAWIELAGAQEDGSYRLQIFHDRLGQLEVDGWFAPSADCSTPPKSETELLSRLGSFDGESVILTGAPADQKICRLQKKNETE